VYYAVSESEVSKKQACDAINGANAFMRAGRVRDQKDTELEQKTRKGHCSR
jgi:hypothetical protein